MGAVKHAHQTAIADDPSSDVSASEWNGDHSVTLTAADVGAEAAGAVAAHEADTTSVHGIADTSTLYRAGGTDVAVADGGTGASTAAAARTNLGLAAVAASGSAADLSAGTLPAARMPALTGDVTTSVGAVATSIAARAVSYAKMQAVSATSRILGRKTAGSGDIEELTAAEVLGMILTTRGDLVTRDATGAIRKPVGTANQYLATDGTDVVWRSRKRWDVEKTAVSTASSAGLGSAVSFATATENADTDAFHDQSTNPSRFTVPAGGDGLYMIEAHADHKGDLSTAGVRRIAIAKGLAGTAVDGTGPFEGYNAVTVGTNSGQGVVQCMALVYLAAGDYVEVFYMQNSGTARSVNFYCRGVLLGA